MSKYTTQVRWIVEETYKEKVSDEPATIYDKIKGAAPFIFNFSYPIWTSTYRPILNQKILAHYLMDEIGLETVGLWKFYLEERLNLIMPYYNKLYETVVKDYDWLNDTNLIETFESSKQLNETTDFQGNVAQTTNGTADVSNNTSNSSDSTLMTNNTDTVTENINGSGTTNVTESNTQTSKQLTSDFPQANYANLDYGTDLVDGTQSNNRTSETETSSNSENNSSHKLVGSQDTVTSDKSDSLTHSAENTNLDSTQKSTNSIDSKTTDSFSRSKQGANGTNSLTKLLMEYRESLINIDNLIINELKDLFMQIY